MNTLELARKLNAVEIIEIKVDPSLKFKNQRFDYLLVLDFEATCWDKVDTLNKRPAEIIEFPVVLYDVKNNEIVEEFQQYVKPTENPRLSRFCVDFTGITQLQIEKSEPLQTVITSFKEWLTEIQANYYLEFSPTNGVANCIFATWSDWDLGTCFRKECNRKGIARDEIFRKWIDIRALYKGRFGRPENGLAGAMSSLGLNFEGNQHCGLHDARNTARLVGEMISNNVEL